MTRITNTLVTKQDLLVLALQACKLIFPLLHVSLKLNRSFFVCLFGVNTLEHDHQVHWICLLVFVHVCQADSLRMGTGLLKNAEAIEQLLGLSKGERASVGQYTKTGWEGEVDKGPPLIGGCPKGGRDGDKDLLLSSVNNSGTSLDTR